MASQSLDNRCRLRPRPERAQGAGEPKPPARGARPNQQGLDAGSPPLACSRRWPPYKLSAQALSHHDRAQGPLSAARQGRTAPSGRRSGIAAPVPTPPPTAREGAGGRRGKARASPCPRKTRQTGQTDRQVQPPACRSRPERARGTKGKGERKPKPPNRGMGGPCTRPQPRQSPCRCRRRPSATHDRAQGPPLPVRPGQRPVGGAAGPLSNPTPPPSAREGARGRWGEAPANPSGRGSASSRRRGPRPPPPPPSALRLETVAGGRRAQGAPPGARPNPAGYSPPPPACKPPKGGPPYSFGGGPSGPPQPRAGRSAPGPRKAAPPTAPGQAKATLQRPAPLSGRDAGEAGFPRAAGTTRRARPPPPPALGPRLERVRPPYCWRAGPQPTQPRAGAARPRGPRKAAPPTAPAARIPPRPAPLSGTGAGEAGASSRRGATPATRRRLRPRPSAREGAGGRRAQVARPQGEAHQQDTPAPPAQGPRPAHPQGQERAQAPPGGEAQPAGYPAPPSRSRRSVPHIVVGGPSAHTTAGRGPLGPGGHGRQPLRRRPRTRTPPKAPPRFRAGAAKRQGLSSRRAGPRPRPDRRPALGLRPERAGAGSKPPARGRGPTAAAGGRKSPKPSLASQEIPWAERPRWATAARRSGQRRNVGTHPMGERAAAAHATQQAKGVRSAPAARAPSPARQPAPHPRNPAPKPSPYSWPAQARSANTTRGQGLPSVRQITGAWRC
ncbi:hypothetical protein C7M84_009183 [Penaeus vannamei]|uniref:Uncharacterized protein n=1 Tax=Penaeus vannamei TaxID=6689 RepID=A0A3R7QMP6_PENVA|nr:hypothetical protein C7M84_009183 [Penaeus vannamei]